MSHIGTQTTTVSATHPGTHEAGPSGSIDASQEAPANTCQPRASTITGSCEFVCSHELLIPSCLTPAGTDSNLPMPCHACPLFHSTLPVCLPPRWHCRDSHVEISSAKKKEGEGAGKDVVMGKSLG